MNKLFTIWRNALQYSETEVEELKRYWNDETVFKVRFILIYLKGFLYRRITYTILIYTDDGISMPKHVFKNSCPFFSIFVLRFLSLEKPRRFPCKLWVKLAAASRLYLTGTQCFPTLGWKLSSPNCKARSSNTSWYWLATIANIRLPISAPSFWS